MMNATAIFLFAGVGLAGLAFAQDPGRFASKRAKSEFELTADPAAPQWKNVPGVIADTTNLGQKLPSNRTEIRSRWTPDNLYLLFICPYEDLYLKPDPSTTTETNKLWNWDVAEAFIGSDFENIHQYKEFQVSPQGEWVDLDIDRKQPKPEGGWLWNSGFGTKARIDKNAKIWYGEMRIPFKSIDPRPAVKGNELRIDLFRFQGGPPQRKLVAWAPTGNPSNHTPEKFGILVLD
ncbi:MAG TPA: carbohydrate-binding family 9-like protein [Bryobacteraceae bacterium]|nr:carbohydrate-binding family 9-like protein [Bryobacteraceae bacterium]